MPIDTIHDHAEKARALETMKSDGSTQVGFAKLNRAIEQEGQSICAIPETSNFSPARKLEIEDPPSPEKSPELPILVPNCRNVYNDLYDIDL